MSDIYLQNADQSKDYRKRILYGILLAPLVPAIFYNLWYLWALYSEPALRYGNPPFWFIVNTFDAYLQFLIYACLCHIILRIGHFIKPWHYCAVMLVVAFCMDIALSIFSLKGYAGYGEGTTEIIKNGAFTSEGILSLIKSSFGNALLYSAAFFVFWKTTHKSAHESLHKIASGQMD